MVEDVIHAYMKIWKVKMDRMDGFGTKIRELMRKGWHV